jgi:hypothetical protein
MNTKYNEAGEMQGILISKNDENFSQSLISMVETLNEHPFYISYFIDDYRISISQESGNIVSLQIKHIEFISICVTSIHIMCGNYSVAIEFEKPQFIIY